LKGSLGLYLNICPGKKELMEHLQQTYRGQRTTESFNEWVEGARDKELGHLYRFHMVEKCTGTTEQVLKRIEAYIRYGASCFMLKFGDHPRDKGMMHLFKTEIMDQIDR